MCYSQRSGFATHGEREGNLGQDAGERAFDDVARVGGGDGCDSDDNLGGYMAFLFSFLYQSQSHEDVALCAVSAGDELSSGMILSCLLLDFCGLYQRPAARSATHLIRGEPSDLEPLPGHLQAFTEGSSRQMRCSIGNARVVHAFPRLWLCRAAYMHLHLYPSTELRLAQRTPRNTFLRIRCCCCGCSYWAIGWFMFGTRERASGPSCGP
ncbi:hypothetical protein R3P38DRAFT_3440161 [Favolaschia claudopus]|uniref:Uncharacterized protein n=1 Tax=Favolaschia claudopus TaxID=2862362 RepID=A0AAW0CW98_9AGAR